MGGGGVLVWIKVFFLILGGILCVYECFFFFFFSKCEKIERLKIVKSCEVKRAIHEQCNALRRS